MSRRARVPPHLALRPFTVDEARAAGLTRYHLRGTEWVRLIPGVYARAGIRPDPRLLLEAIARRLPVEATFSGLSGAFLIGSDVEPAAPAEATLPPGSRVSGRAGLRIRRARLDESEVVVVGGLRATSPARTLADLARALPLIDATAIADEMLHGRLTTVEDIDCWLGGHPRAQGTARLRRVLELAEPKAESPMESRLRLLLVLAGLPRPEAQVSLHDERGRFLARPDLLYPAERVALEYDGAVHRDRLVADDRRQNRLLAAGYQLLRFTAPDVLGNPGGVAAQVRAALRAAGRRIA